MFTQNCKNNSGSSKESAVLPGQGFDGKRSLLDTYNCLNFLEGVEAELESQPLTEAQKKAAVANTVRQRLRKCKQRSEYGKMIRLNKSSKPPSLIPTSRKIYKMKS